jgi:hypothetical protein|uniref:Uncharacterized protein n=1 Tax=Myoviridae sp. ctshb19 TaxID=2825194 RepID=A0A8S5UH66_9CAUD|nr:MAG TPA: hypothetical protein [Myoviridae sp. ctshb19]
MNQEIAVASVPNQPVYSVGTEVWFHPAIRTLNLGALQDVAIRAKVLGITVRETQIQYELAMDVSTSKVGDYYEAIPLAQVDSFFVLTKDHLLELNGLDDADVYKSYASAIPSSAVIRKFAQRYQEIQNDLPHLRREIGRA